jgi:hypothetical protein
VQAGDVVYVDMNSETRKLVFAKRLVNLLLADPLADRFAGSVC